MTDRKKVIAISGSVRRNSANLRLIKAIDELTREKFKTNVFEGLTELPDFNPDLDTDHPPEAVNNFRKLLKKCRRNIRYVLPNMQWEYREH